MFDKLSDVSIVNKNIASQVNSLIQLTRLSNNSVTLQSLLQVVGGSTSRTIDVNLPSLSDSMQSLLARVRDLETRMSADGSNVDRLVALDSMGDLAMDASTKMQTVLDRLKINDNSTLMIFDATDNERLIQSMVRQV